MGRAATTKAKAEQATLGEKMRRRSLLVEVRKEAAEFSKGLARGIDPAEGVQTVLDNLAGAYEYATLQVMTLQEDDYWVDGFAGKMVNHWIREQERLGLQLVHVAGKASSMGLAQRQVMLQEAQAAIFARVVEAVLTNAGIPLDKRHQIHRQIGEALADVESTATLIGEAAA